MNKVVLSGIKPTGRPHIGNYFGAMKPLVDLSANPNMLVMIADYHALTTARDPDTLRRDTFDLVIDLLAVGLDPKRAIIFRQSDVPAHAELTWIFNCLTTMPYLMRAHAYKDAEAKNKDISVGLLDYPILMAADILLYDTDLVPVGQDQKQHVEVARDTAEKFNRTYGETFKLPAPLINENLNTIIGLDGRKMSKSYGNTIQLFAEDEEIKEAIMSMVTDSKGEKEPKDPQKCNLFALHKLFSSSQLAEIEKRYLSGNISYKESKEILINNFLAFVKPLRDKRWQFAADTDRVAQIIKDGAARAGELARRKMILVRQRIGVD